MNESREVLNQRVVEAKYIKDVLGDLFNQHEIVRIVLGNGTGSKEVRAKLRALHIPSEKITIVDESFTSLAARIRYFSDHPPKGIRRLVPISLRLPAEDYDDYVAIILAEQFLSIKK